ncbi:rhodanese-related sulfurtransferase [Hyphomicrobium sp. 99]|uniref:oxygen-dependent tRNA uridine(34) hydroxylase TrhO n=1 Tax=Hyphomicrobium sp. 99 TaxID=1163419 RepID=UPI0005F866F7|nr:rhodanese-related sulfurtransferase [Hyphomicrobium sp. 99]
MTVKVAAFYKFVPIDDPAELQTSLREVCLAHAIKGTILIAREGINATVSGASGDIDALIATIVSDARFSDLEVKYSEAGDHPFQRLKVKIKREIVTFGVPDAQPAVATGTFVEPDAWNALISEPDVLVIDTRNDYEFQVGTFEGAHNPETRAFNEFPDYVKRTLASDPKRRIAMFCTGGIRCEKASAFLLREGFPNVYQLNGGILRYLEKVPPEESLWRGECFVFDERVALEHGVRQGHHTLCSQCGFPIRKPDESVTTLCEGCRESKATAG